MNSCILAGQATKFVASAARSFFPDIYKCELNTYKPLRKTLLFLRRTLLMFVRRDLPNVYTSTEYVMRFSVLCVTKLSGIGLLTLHGLSCLENGLKSATFIWCIQPVLIGPEFIETEPHQIVFIRILAWKADAYPFVANYVRNTWSKYELVKSMLNSSNGLFFFQFSSKDGLDAMLENVKLHGVLMTAFSEDGLNVITTKLGSLLMLDFYTSEMCMKSWGRSSYVRAMIELRVDVELCSSCKVFRHVLNECPKKVISDVVKNLNNPREATRGVLVGLKINKIERKIIKGKLMFVDDDENPLAPMSNVDNESEVEVVFDETANLMASTSFEGGSDKSYGINSMLEQWKETKQNADSDLYNDDVYEIHDMFDHTL
uniref:DUF4283 domain-containing protein n=1 Tax=Tanacetum cinerariifolium TaxID=118510 RepID=A0A6L2NXN7_TANCI|nr:hypothetical protein [Tanacetum cinerariifolium]